MVAWRSATLVLVRVQDGFGFGAFVLGFAVLGLDLVRTRLQFRPAALHCPVGV